MSNRHRSINMILCVPAFLFAVVADASAGLVTIEFQGTVTEFVSIPVDLATVLHSLGVGVGESLTGTYTFDTSTPDQFFLSDDRGVYAANSLHVAAGQLELDPTNAVITIINHPPPFPGFDVYKIGTTSDIPAPPAIVAAGYPTLVFSFQLLDPSTTVFVDDTLPLASPDLEAFQWADGAFFFYAPDDPQLHSVDFDLDRIEVVPEPGTLALLTPVAWTLWRQRRRSISSSG